MLSETDPHHEEACAIFNEVSARLAPVILELVTSWVHSHADILPQSMGVEAALLRAAASFAGIVSKHHSLDMELFVGMARAEFDRVAAKVKAEAAAEAKPDSDDTGVRH